MNVLLIGSGGREHALSWKLAQSPILTKLYVAPGNPGIGHDAECVDLNVSDHDAIIAFCADHAIDLVVVGPEAPLVDGIADALSASGVSVFGPSRSAARLEGSKGFAKDLCARMNIPTGACQRFNNAPKAKAYVRSRCVPIVIKADGPAAGKGVTVAMSVEEACDAIDNCFEGGFGEAGSEIVVEEYLEGEEASFFCLCDGSATIVPFGTAQDHKRAGEGDTGPNTGGMGAYSPASVMNDEMVERVLREIIEPTVRGMKRAESPFKGVLYAGLMLTADGPKLIEYNVRFGDPECQVLMMRLKGDLLPILKAAADGDLSGTAVDWRGDAALTVVMAARGYPGSPEVGTVISGVPDVTGAGAAIFHAGTAMNDGRLVAAGGRVLNVTALGATVVEAQGAAYAAVDAIDWPEGFCRRDIGWREIEREA